MAIVKQRATVAGTPIDNTNADMVITLEENPNVRIKEGGISADSIEYEFINQVSKDETWTPTVTFTYKEIYKATAQLSLKQLFPVIYVPTAVDIDTTVWANGATLPFKVMSGEEDITAQLVDVSFTPTDNVVDYSTVGGTAGNWYITASAAEGAVTRTVQYKYKLPLAIDPNQTERTIDCNFKVAAYDGVELKVSNAPANMTVGNGQTTTAPYDFTVWYRGVPNPAEVVSVQADSTFADVATLANQSATATVRSINLTGSAVGAGDAVLHFGVDATHTNHVEVTVPLRVYQPGFVRTISSTDITGEIGDHVETTLEYQLDDVVIPNNQITITADDYITVESTEAGTISWEIIASNTTDAPVEHTAVVSVSYLTHNDSYNQKVTVNPNPSLTWAEGSVFEGEGETTVTLTQQVNDPNA